jgi:hypothetical protein
VLARDGAEVRAAGRLGEILGAKVALFDPAAPAAPAAGGALALPAADFVRAVEVPFCPKTCKICKIEVLNIHIMKSTRPRRKPPGHAARRRVR